MHRRLVFAMSLMAMSLTIGAPAVAGPTAVELLDLLRTRANARQSFTADVTETISPGEGREEHYHAWVRWVDLIEEHNPEFYAQLDSEWHERQRNGGNGGLSSEPRFQQYQYAWSAPGLIRVKHSGEEGYGRIHVFDGRHWLSYRELGLSMSIVDYPPQNYFELGHGAAIKSPLGRDPSPTTYYGFFLSPEAQVRGTIGWNELLDLVDMETVTLSEELHPRSNVAMPCIQVRSPEGDFPIGKVRCFQLSLWFDPSLDHQLTAAIMSRADAIGDMAAPEIVYPTSVLMTWSDPLRQENDVVFQEGRIGFFQTLSHQPPDGLRELLATEEMHVYSYKFSNCVVDSEPLDEKTFQIQPAIGTNVIDQPHGIRYLVGELGQPTDVTFLTEFD